MNNYYFFLNSKLTIDDNEIKYIMNLTLKNIIIKDNFTDNEFINIFINKYLKNYELLKDKINIKKIKRLNKIYESDLESFKTIIGGTTIYKVYPFITKKLCFTTNDVVTECKLHINSVNKVLNKLVEHGYLTKEKKKGTNRVTFSYNNMLDVFCK